MTSSFLQRSYALAACVRPFTGVKVEVRRKHKEQHEERFEGIPATFRLASAIGSIAAPGTTLNVRA